MKRALAERAKQSGLPTNGVGPSVPSLEPSSGLSSPPSSQPDLSRSAPKPESPPSTPALNTSFSKNPLSIANSNGGGPVHPSSATSPRPSPRPKKRLRESSSVVKLEEEEEEDSNASAFYLRHQNRALASELRQLKYQLYRLEQERDVRRSQCSMAIQCVNALQATWTQLESALQNGQGAFGPDTNEGSIPALGSSSGSAPLSTGSGTSVELVGALLNSLAELGNNTGPGGRRKQSQAGDNMDVDDISSSSDGDDPEMAVSEPLPPPEGMEDDDADRHNQQQLIDLLRISDNVAKRASTLQGWIWTLLQKCGNLNGSGGEWSVAPQEVHTAHQQVARLKAKNKTLKAQLKELARSRDEFQQSDKRVRRGLYRLATGRMQLKEVLKDIVASDEDKEVAAEWMVENGGSTSLTVVTTTAANPTTATSIKTEDADGKESNTVSSAEVAQFQKRINDLEQIASARDDQIKSLLVEREELSKKINSLVLASNGKSTEFPTDEAIKKSDLYAEMKVKLLAAERTIKELEEKQVKIKEEWGQALATANEAQKAIEDLNEKHVKRWTDLVEEFPELDSSGGAEGEAAETSESSDNNVKAKEIITLQHKLTQALENVRQAQATRMTLQEAVIMNDSLNSRLEEIKAKYATLQQNRANNAGTNDTAVDIGLATPKAKSPATGGASSSEKLDKLEKSDKSDKSSDKLHREYRRIQKQLAAATASKESAKAKLEKAEKERDLLNSANSRLLRQAAEKDEMNAKSLSTILHLKQLTDQVTKEKENLEQQVKSSQQLALSARLVANARERLAEEIDNERKAMESRVKEWEEKCSSLAKEKEQIETRMLQNRSRMAGLMKEVEGAKGRCDELASESTKMQEEKQRIMEALAIAKKDAEEAAKLTERISKASGGAIVEGFTAEQLHTQVKHLKSRVHCPVCNVRDKKCILLRCRHMFCKNCVDENIKNRSRKCPACGIRFDTKDVGDIWL